MRDDIIVGARFPDYELPDHTNARRRLSELQGDDPLILILARGAYCPKCCEQHRELVAFHRLVAVAYTRIVTITTEGIEGLNAFRDTVGAQWTFLSDAAREVQRDLAIQEYTDLAHDPLIPYSLVLAPGLIVHSLYNGYWFWGRPSPDELRRDLREVTRAIRPDWDLAVPGLKQAWDDADHSLHYPYRAD
jgi:peroxiredoxin